MYLDNGMQASSSYGLPVAVDGKLYVVSVSPDGKTVSAKPYRGPSCCVRISRPAWSAHLEGQGASFDLSGGMDPVPIPPGRYTITKYTEYSSADPNVPRYKMVSGAGGADFDISADKVFRLPFSSPLLGKLTARVRERTAEFHYSEHNEIGMPADIWLPGDHSGANYQRTLIISDAQHRPVYKMGMSWDWGNGNWSANWQPLDGLSGTFTATVEHDTGPFITKPATATFTVK